MSKKLLLTLLVLGVITSVGYFGTSYVLADDDNPVHQTLISRLAQKFNLKESDVEAVFTAVRDERQAQMHQERQERLNQSVKDGVISSSQKDALLAKMQEHMGERQQNRSEMQSWFESQGIDQIKLREYLRPAGKGEGRGMGMNR